MVKTTHMVRWGSPLVSSSLVPSWSSDDSSSSSLSLSASTSSSSVFDDVHSCKDDDDDVDVPSSGRVKSWLVRRSSLTKSTRIAITSPSASEAAAAPLPKKLLSPPPSRSPAVIDGMVHSPGSRRIGTASPSSSRPPRQQQQQQQQQQQIQHQHHQHLQHLLSPNRPKKQQQQTRQQQYQPNKMFEEDDDPFSPPPPPPPPPKPATPMRRWVPAKKQSPSTKKSSPMNPIQRVTTQLTKAIRSSASSPPSQKQQPTQYSPQTRPFVTKENVHSGERTTSIPRFATPRFATRRNSNHRTHRDTDRRDIGGEGFEVIESDTTSPKINYTKNRSNSLSPLRSITAQPNFENQSAVSSEANHPVAKSNPTSRNISTLSKRSYPSLGPINRCHNPIDSGSSFSESVTSTSSTEGMTHRTHRGEVDGDSDYHDDDCEEKDLHPKNNGKPQHYCQPKVKVSERRIENALASVDEGCSTPDPSKTEQVHTTNIVRHDSNGSSRSSTSNCSNVGVYHYNSESDTNKSIYGGTVTPKNNDWNGNIYNSTTKDSLYVSFVMMNTDDEGNIETVQYTTAASASGRRNTDAVPTTNTTTTTLSSSSLDTILARPFSDQPVLTESSLSIGEGSSSIGMDEPVALLELISSGSSSLDQTSNRKVVSRSRSTESSCPSDENNLVERRSMPQENSGQRLIEVEQQGPKEHTTIPEELSILPQASTSTLELPVQAFNSSPESDSSNKISFHQQQRKGNELNKLDVPRWEQTSQFQQHDQGPHKLQQIMARPANNNSHLLSSSLGLDQNDSVVHCSRSSASDSSVTRTTLDDYSSHRIRTSLLSLDEEETDDSFHEGEDSSYYHQNDDDNRALFYVESDDHDDYIYAKEPIKQKQYQDQPQQTLHKICSFQSTKRCYKPRRSRRDRDQNQLSKGPQESQPESQEKADGNEQHQESQHKQEQQQEQRCPNDQNQQSENQHESPTELKEGDKDDDDDDKHHQEVHQKQEPHQEQRCPDEDISEDLEQQDEPKQQQPQPQHQEEKQHDGDEMPPDRKDEPPDRDQQPPSGEDQRPSREEKQRELKELLMLGPKLPTKPKFINSFHGSTFSPVYQVHKMDWEQLTKRRLQQRRMRMLQKQQQEQQQEKRNATPLGNPNSVLTRRNMDSILLSSSSSSSSFLSISTRNSKSYTNNDNYFYDDNDDEHFYNQHRSSSIEVDESRHDRYSSYYDDVEDEDDDELCNIITTKFSATKNNTLLYKEQSKTERTANKKSGSFTWGTTSNEVVSYHNVSNIDAIHRNAMGKQIKDLKETSNITVNLLRDDTSCTDQPNQHQKREIAHEHDDCNDSIFSSIIETAPSDELHVDKTNSDSSSKTNLNNSNNYIDTIICQEENHDDDQMDQEYKKERRNKERMMPDEFSSYPEYLSKTAVISSLSNTESPKASYFANYCHDGVISGATSNYSSIVEETDYDDDDDLDELLEDDLLDKDDDESSGIADHSYSRDDLSTISSCIKASSLPTPSCFEKEWEKNASFLSEQRDRKGMRGKVSVTVEKMKDEATKHYVTDNYGSVADEQSPMKILCQEVVTSIESDDTDIAITSSTDWHDTDFNCVPNLLFNRQTYDAEERQDTNVLGSRGMDSCTGRIVPPLHGPGQCDNDPKMCLVDDQSKSYGTKNIPQIESRSYCIVSDCSADSMSEVRDSFVSLLTTPKTRIGGKRNIFGVVANANNDSIPEEKPKLLPSLMDDAVPFDEELNDHLANYQCRNKGTEQTIIQAGRNVYFKKLAETATSSPFTASNHQRRNQLMKFLFDDPDDTSLLMSIPNRIILDLFERSLSRLWYVTMNCVALRAVLINTDVSVEKKMKTIDSVSLPAAADDSQVCSSQRPKEHCPVAGQEALLLQKEKYPILVEEQRLINHHFPDFESFVNCGTDDSSFKFPSALYQCCDEVNVLTENCATEPSDNMSSVAHNDIQFRFVRSSKGSDLLKQQLLIVERNEPVVDRSDEVNRDDQQHQPAGIEINEGTEASQTAPITRSLLTRTKVDCDNDYPFINCATTENNRTLPVSSKIKARCEPDDRTSQSFRLDPNYLIIRLTKWRNANGTTSVKLDEREQDIENEIILNDNTATKFQAVLESPISSNKVNIRIDKKNRVVCSTSILPFVTCTTPPSKQVASFEAEDDDVSIEFVDEQQRLVQDDELRALMQITQHGDDISTLFPSFSSFEETSLNNPYSTDEDDGLERELNALMTHGIELRNEIVAYDRVFKQSSGTKDAPPISAIQESVELDEGWSADTLDSNSTGPEYPPPQALNPVDQFDLPSAEVVRRIMEAVNEELPLLLSTLSTVHESSNEDSDADDDTEIIEQNMSHQGLTTPSQLEFESSTPINSDQNYRSDDSKILLSPRWHKPEGSNVDLPSQFDECTSSEKDDSDDQLSAVDSFPPVDHISDSDMMVNETSSFIMSTAKDGAFHVNNTAAALTSNSFASIGSGNICRVSPQSNLCQRKVTFSEHVEEFLYFKDNLSNYNFNPVDDTTVENPPGIFPSIDEMKGILTELVDEIHKVVNTATIVMDRTCTTSMDNQVVSPRQEMNTFL